MNKAYLLLGSNEGNRENWLQTAIQQLHSYGSITATSSLYQTAAWGLEEQPDFLNMAVCLDTALPAMALLKGIQQIELDLGRQRSLKWGQRTLDIDIIFYNNDIIDMPELKIPHPHVHERRFALAPLKDIAAMLVHPIYNTTVAELYEHCPDPLAATLYQH